jgi:hypothetical protein
MLILVFALNAYNCSNDRIVNNIQIEKIEKEIVKGNIILTARINNKNLQTLPIKIFLEKSVLVLPEHKPNIIHADKIKSKSSLQKGLNYIKFVFPNDFNISSQDEMIFQFQFNIIKSARENITIKKEFQKKHLLP